MRKANRVFTRAERKVALWALLAATILTATGLAFDRLAPPPLGVYDQNYGAPALTDVLDARPIG